MPETVSFSEGFHSVSGWSLSVLPALLLRPDQWLCHSWGDSRGLWGNLQQPASPEREPGKVAQSTAGPNTRPALPSPSTGFSPCLATPLSTPYRSCPTAWHEGPGNVCWSHVCVSHNLGTLRKKCKSDFALLPPCFEPRGALASCGAVWSSIC